YICWFLISCFVISSSFFFFFFFSSRRRHTRCLSDWSSDVCSSDLCQGCTGTPASAWFASRFHALVPRGTSAMTHLQLFKDGWNISEERRVGKECRSHRGRER